MSDPDYNYIRVRADTTTDPLIRRLTDPPFGTETSERNLMAAAARHLLDAWAERDAAQADAEAAVALMVVACAEEADRRYAAGDMGNPGHHIRALATASGLAAVQELRAERDESRSYALALEQELRDRAEATEAIERDVDREYKRAEKAARDLSTSNYQVERLQALTVRLDAERDTLAVELAASRAREAGLRGAVEALCAVLDRNDKKGPIPDVEMMFCWLAAQGVRAAFRSDGLSYMQKGKTT